MKRFSVFVVSLTFFFVTVPQAQIKVACIGNSITEGYRLTDPSTQSYPARLQSLLGTGYQVQNEGVSGTFMLKNSSSPYWTKGKLPQTFAFKPNIITIKLGTNDANTPSTWSAHYSEFKRDYLAMIDTLNTISTKPKIFPVLPVPLWSNNDTAMQKVIVIIKQIALERGQTYIDCYTPLKPFQSYFPDGLHPNAAGADTIAHVIFRAITASPSIVIRSGQSAARASANGSSLVPIFAGTNLAGIYKSLMPGQRYEIRVFDVKGALVSREYVESASARPASVLSSLKSTPAVRWVSVRKL
jgi:alpha-L-fucosidase 2